MPGGGQEPQAQGESSPLKADQQGAEPELKPGILLLSSLLYQVTLYLGDICLKLPGQARHS